MAEVNPPFVIDGTTVAGEEIRRTLKALTKTQGVLAYGDLAITQNGTPNMSVNVAAGEAIIFGTEQTEQGAYHVYNDATVNKTISAADATNPRYDLIMARVRDAEYSGATRAWDILVKTGTPAASPAVPGGEANSLNLGVVLVGAGVTSITTANITDYRVRADRLGYTKVRRTAGNYTLNSASWANVDTGLDLTLAAAAGDVIEYAINGLWGNEAVAVALDVECTASGTKWGGGGTGLVGWRGPVSVENPVSGSAFRTLVAADVSSGNVVLRLKYKTDSAANKTLYGTTNEPLDLVARNLGPA